MICELIAHTEFSPGGVNAMKAAGYEFQSPLPTSSDELAEFAGRACYRSWGRPNPTTATNEGYLAHIIEVEHTSVYEHASATFWVAEVSRSLLMELRTHRHLSFSAQSQRYVDESEARWMVPPALQEGLDPGDRPGEIIAAALSDIHDLTTLTYRNIVHELTRKGYSRKQAREAARCVLPNAVETRFVVTGNMWAWKYVLRKRLAEGADAEIRQLAQKILAHLKMIAPNTFQDLSQEPPGTEPAT